MTDKHGISLYVHVPFCRSKCPYCAFYSFRPQSGMYERWLKCVTDEIEKIRDATAGRKFDSVYIGGGTPSVLPEEIWNPFLKLLETLPRTEDCEFTVEGNPESVTSSKLAMWRDGGVNRLSIGVQSLNDDELKMMARPHTATEALRVLAECLDRGFRVSADLIFALPHQSLRMWHSNMSRLVHEGIRHMSVYQLMIEPDAYWGRHVPDGLPDGYPHYRWAQYYLPLKGLKQYEVSAFAVPGEESRHNCRYWTRDEVYAAGPAAWGYVGGTRFANCKDFVKWAEAVESGKSAVDFTESLTGSAEAAEAAVLALRMTRGIEYESFAARYGRENLDRIVAILDGMPESDILRRKDGIALSGAGMRVGNAIWSEIVL